MYQKEIKKLLANEDTYLLSLRKIIEESVAQEKNLIESILNPEKESLTKGQKLSDKVASFGGSWKFIISFFTYIMNIITSTITFIFFTFFLGTPNGIKIEFSFSEIEKLFDLIVFLLFGILKFKILFVFSSSIFIFSS